MRKRGLGGLARGLLVLAALLLPLAATLATPRQGSADQAAQDTLWAGDGSNVGVCADPASAASLSGCFASATSTWSGLTIDAVATDGVNVYLAGKGGGLSCPIAGLGTNCSQIMAGPWPQKYSGNIENSVNAMAAADGQIWIGQQNGQIIQCPANLPYASQDSVPSQCVVLDDAGQRSVYSLLLAGGRLYAGLGYYGALASKQGILWSCDPQTQNACSTLDSYGEVWANSLVAGGGYVWAGLTNGVVWRCDPDTTNSCDNWDTAGNAVNSLSYDGEGTLYAAIQGGSAGVIWSCPTAAQNSCSNLLTKVDGHAVAAGAGGVFSSASSDLRFGTSRFSGASTSIWDAPVLLYLPASGPTGVGAADVSVSVGALPSKLERRCRSDRSKGPQVLVTARGPYGMTKSQRVGLCALRDGATVERTFSLLDAGSYLVTARSKNGAYVAHGKLTIEAGTTKTIDVLLVPRNADG